MIVSARILRKRFSTRIPRATYEPICKHMGAPVPDEPFRETAAQLHPQAIDVYLNEVITMMAGLPVESRIDG